ncbi:hypothetical protein [Paludisphaera mucosa]|uniref:Uncharacterized protein n=1 Tax=Paludisphaera mucosa TaxID=3030827 RepID=A0ABT6F8G3_9BACT|nr:hypothetical protein [Paludisphaera mucosa]MDG3003879.1 hypothetical protein [Paludisphaera mucosa]
MIQSGRRGRYHWLVSETALPSLGEATVRFHPGARLCITAYDSGPIQPWPEEEGLGWTTRGSVMMSPPLAGGLHIPQDDYDEWYLLNEPPRPDWRPEIFVNYSGFSLVPVDDPTSDRLGLEYLVPIQERFWAQIEQIDPASYIAIGDQDVVVSKHREFIDHIRDNK